MGASGQASRAFPPANPGEALGRLPERSEVLQGAGGSPPGRTSGAKRGPGKGGRPLAEPTAEFLEQVDGAEVEGDHSDAGESERRHSFRCLRIASTRSDVTP